MINTIIGSIAGRQVATEPARSRFSSLGTTRFVAKRETKPNEKQKKEKEKGETVEEEEDEETK